jgi:hypothetical protein
MMQSSIRIASLLIVSRRMLSIGSVPADLTLDSCGALPRRIR